MRIFQYTCSMIRRIVECLVILLLITTMGASSVQAASLTWQQLAPGIDYREFYLSGPNHVYVTRLDRSNPQVFLETSLANGSLSNGLQPLSDQVALYDEALSHWDGVWGGRNKVIAAINGGFYNTDTGIPVNGLVQSGWYAKRFEDRETVGGIAWRDDRQAFVIECLIQRQGKQQVILLDTGQSIGFDGINVLPEDDQLILYTPQYGAQTPPSEKGLDIVVDIGHPLELLPDSELITGTVRVVRQDQGSTPLLFDQIVLSANGRPAQSMDRKFGTGTRVGIAMEIRHLDSGCRKERPEILAGVYSAIAGSYVFLRQGQVQPLNDLGSVLRNPRTAVALNDRYVFFVVVDGRDQLRSLGMSMVELGLFSKLSLGATWGVAMDGGGSSTMVVNGDVVNNPNAETVVKAKPEKQPRAIADGLMMVVLQPAQRSQRFQAGNQVTISAEGDANLRLGPGTNYASLTLLRSGSPGTILLHPLNGIMAKGNYWWQASFDDQIGWVSESVLIAGS
jgi:Phosphodiester glycosidase